jgi:hypothetical protein
MDDLNAAWPLVLAAPSVGISPSGAVSRREHAAIVLLYFGTV